MQEDQCIAEWVGDLQTHHSASLLAGIDQCLRRSNLSMKNVDWISVGIGPGMFTGLRVGVSTAKFLAEALNCNVVAVSSLLAIAWRGKSLGAKAPCLWALSDARSQRVYALKLPTEQISPLHKDAPEEAIAITPAELIPHLKVGDCLIGEGAKIYSTLWPKFVEQPIADDFYKISAKSIGEIGWARKKMGQEISPLELQPRYLKTGQNHLP